MSPFSFIFPFSITNKGYSGKNGDDYIFLLLNTIPLTTYKMDAI